MNKDDQSPLMQRLERRLESLVESTSARVFGGVVVPEEINTALRCEAANGIQALPGKHLITPDHYIVSLSPQDYNNLYENHQISPIHYSQQLAEYIHRQDWHTLCDIVVEFIQSPSLHTGQIRIQGSISSKAGYTASPQSREHTFYAQQLGVTSMNESSEHSIKPGKDLSDIDYHPQNLHSFDGPRHAVPTGSPQSESVLPTHDQVYDQSTLLKESYNYSDHNSSVLSQEKINPSYTGLNYPEHHTQERASSSYSHSSSQQHNDISIKRDDSSNKSSGLEENHLKMVATLHLDDGSGRNYQLIPGSNIIGRGQETHFRLPDTGVSRRHLNINWNGQVAFLLDLNSTNGTIVNNTPVQEWQLADGDVIHIGHSEIIIHIH